MSRNIKFNHVLCWYAVRSKYENIPLLYNKMIYK